ncbi:MAG TPA: orotidine-5'-phosphate decarboxylase [Blastocatellia bacterium]|nr:orotidine-5'-phosphate decarboxylase [Blastocatellia bacterium]
MILDNRADAAARLILALDLPTRARALEFIHETEGLVGSYKIGSQLFTAEGPTLVRDIVARGQSVFLDLKFHDIPNTVAGAAVEAARLGVRMLTIHALGGETMMRRAVEAVHDLCDGEGLTPPRLIAVTLLTSLGREDLKKIHLSGTPEEIVADLAELAYSCGMDGVVASAHECPAIRARVTDPRFVLIVPGIRPADSSPHDQQRIVTPGHALRLGADYLVVGRPILESPTPRQAAERILAEIAAYCDRHLDTAESDLQGN